MRILFVATAIVAYIVMLCLFYTSAQCSTAAPC